MLPAGSIYITVANSGYQGDWVETGASECCSNVTGTAKCGSSSGISVSAAQNVTIASESSYQYIFNISKLSTFLHRDDLACNSML